MLELKLFSHLKLHPVTLLFTDKQNRILSYFQNKRNGLKAMALRSKIQNWILSKIIQFSTFIQIICLIIMGFVNVGNVFNYYEGGRITMPEASYYLCWFIRFLKESEHKTYALASIIVVNVCLIYCTWMEKQGSIYCY